MPDLPLETDRLLIRPWRHEEAARLLETGQVLGSVLLLTLPNDEHGEVEIGWHLHPDSWGHGYASEAARAVLEHGFAGGLDEILAVTQLDNERSQAVMGRVGLRDRGVVERWYDEPSRLFGITAEEWRSR